MTGNRYLLILQSWLTDKLIANERKIFIFQQDGAPLHAKLHVWAYLNYNFPGRLIGHAGSEAMSC